MSAMQRRKYWMLLWVIFVTSTAVGQLSSRVRRLEGVWKYKEGSGYEVWKASEDELIGTAFRLNHKTGDRSKMEDMLIRRVKNNVVYTMTTFSYFNDSIKETIHRFVGGKRKMKWYNIHSEVPHVIQYSLGFFRPNRLVMRIHYGPHDRPTKLLLLRQNDVLNPEQ